MLFHFFKKKNAENGYILLLAILVTSIILAISFGIYAIGIKEVILSSYIRDSQQAFAAADRALECALMWDVPYRDQLGLRWSVFATGTIANEAWFNNAQEGQYQYAEQVILDEVKCGNQYIFHYNTGTGHVDRPTGSIACDTDLSVDSKPMCSQAYTGIGGGWETRFIVKFEATDRTCAYVRVVKQPGVTIFTSDGYNDCNPSNPRRTQRTIEVTSR